MTSSAPASGGAVSPRQVQARYSQQVAARQALTQQVAREPVSLARALNREFRIRPHTRAISDAFLGLKDHDRGVSGHDRILIVTPPQIGKSQLASVWAPLWWMIGHPRHRIAISSYSGLLAKKRGREIRDIVKESGPEFGIQLAVSPRAADDWSLSTGGGCRSVGVGGGLTGHAADMLVCDDPFRDRAEAESLTQRDNVDDWWSSTAMTRLSPGAPVVLILTRWHPDDLAGRLLEREGRVEDGGRWHVVHLPAVADTALTGDDPIGRATGDPLTHPKIPTSDKAALSAHWSDKQSTVSMRDWFALFQGDPQPAEGALLTSKQLRDQRHMPIPATPVKHVVAVDPSGGGRDTAGIIGGCLADDGRVYITHDRTVSGPTDQWATAAAQLAADVDAEWIVFESNFGGDMGRTVIRSAWDRLQRDNPHDGKYQRLAPHIHGETARKGKYLRAEPIAQQFLDDRVRLGAYLPELESEWSRWQPTSPDSPGRIDASVFLVYAMLTVPGSEARISTGANLTQQQAAQQAAQRGPIQRVTPPAKRPG